MANAGRILILPKGAWVNTTNYTQLDLVTQSGTAYLARQASIGIDPTTDTSYTYWQPFGSSAGIATTSVPGLVMPDGVTISVDNTGLIQAALGVSDLSNVNIVTLADGQVLRYNSSTLKWENKSLGTAASKNSTNAVTQGSAALVESGAVYTEVAKKGNAPTILTATLTAGSTTLTFTDNSIGNNSRIRPYSNPFVLGLIEDMSQNGTTVTLTCKEQDSNVSIKLEVFN